MLTLILTLPAIPATLVGCDNGVRRHSENATILALTKKFYHMFGIKYTFNKTLWQGSILLIPNTQRGSH